MKTFPCHVTNTAGNITIEVCPQGGCNCVELPEALIQKYQEAECYWNHVQSLLKAELSGKKG